MSHRDVEIPFSEIPPGNCRWCGERIVHGRRRARRWHDGRQDEPDCLHAYRLVSDHDYVRSIAQRDGHYFCVECGRPGPGCAPTLALVRSRLIGHFDFAVSWLWYDIAQTADPARWRERHDVLEVDHIEPLIDGGPHAVENLQLLCTTHHRAKTSREASARALRRRQTIRGTRLAELDRARRAA